MSAGEVTRAMHGDHDAFAALIGSAADRLYALACLILRDSDRAEDATQEAFVRAWREMPRLRDVDRFDAWLRRLVVNACYDEARRVRRRAEVSLVHISDRGISDSSSAFAETDRVDRAFRRLPIDQRTVLVLQHHFALGHHRTIRDELEIQFGLECSGFDQSVVDRRPGLRCNYRRNGVGSWFRLGTGRDRVRPRRRLGPRRNRICAPARRRNRS